MDQMRTAGLDRWADGPDKDRWIDVGLVLGALAAAVMSFAAWTGLGILVGIDQDLKVSEHVDLKLAWLLQGSIEGYGLVSLRIWLVDRVATAGTKEYAKWNAVGAIALSFLGNAVYHLARQFDWTKNPWWAVAVVLVTGLPAVMIGLSVDMIVRRKRDREALSAQVTGAVQEAERIRAEARRTADELTTTATKDAEELRERAWTEAQEQLAKSTDQERSNQAEADRILAESLDRSKAAEETAVRLVHEAESTAAQMVQEAAEKARAIVRGAQSKDRSTAERSTGGAGPRPVRSIRSTSSKPAELFGQRLDRIRQAWPDRSYAPTVREVQDHLDLSSRSMAMRLYNAIKAERSTDPEGQSDADPEPAQTA